MGLYSILFSIYTLTMQTDKINNRICTSIVSKCLPKDVVCVDELHQLRLYLKLKDELVKYGGLSKSLRFRQFLTSFMVGKVTLDVLRMPLSRNPSLVPLHRVTSSLYSSRLKYKLLSSQSDFVLCKQNCTRGGQSVPHTGLNILLWFIEILQIWFWISVNSSLWGALIGLYFGHTSTNHIDWVIITNSWIRWRDYKRQRVSVHIITS